MSHFDLFDFFSFIMSPEVAFHCFYLLLSAFGLVAAIKLRRRAAAWLERREAQALLGAVAAPSGGEPYRAWSATPQPSQLAIGWIPRQDDRWSVAYLRGGAAALADTLLVVALAEG